MAGVVALAGVAVAWFTGCGTSDSSIGVMPSLALLLPGAQQQFRSTDTRQVTWRASGGTITDAGLYTAPAAFGAYTVTAALVSDYTAIGTAQVLVGLVAVTVTPGGASLLHGETQQFTASVTGPSTNHDVTWSASAGTIDAGGLFTAPETNGVVVVTATSVADPTDSGQAVVVVSDSRIRIQPAGVVLAALGQQTFTATAPGLDSDAVTWSTNGGQIGADGHYTAPAGNGQYLVTATSQVDPNVSATALVVVSEVQMGVTPSGASLLPGQTQQFIAAAVGLNDQSVTWSATAGSITAGGLFTAPDVPAGTSITVTATSVAIPTLSADAAVLVNDIGVQIAPFGAVVIGGQTQQFSATVSGTANTAVSWSATGGGVDNSGLFTAPAAAGSYTVTATSDADPAASASATVVVPAVFVTVSPGLAAVPTHGTANFHATVLGSANTAVAWSASAGSVSTAGVYTAPATAGTYTVTATSVADPSSSATASVVVTRTTGDLGVLIGRNHGR